MEWPVIIGRIVGVIPSFGHLIPEPAIDPFVEMRRFDVQIHEPDHRRKEQDQHWK
jgi:hypothetical protein